MPGEKTPRFRITGDHLVNAFAIVSAFSSGLFAGYTTMYGPLTERLKAQVMHNPAADIVPGSTPYEDGPDSERGLSAAARPSDAIITGTTGAVAVNDPAAAGGTERHEPADIALAPQTYVLRAVFDGQALLESRGRAGAGG